MRSLDLPARNFMSGGQQVERIYSHGVVVWEINPPDPQVLSVTIDPTQATVNRGQTRQFSAVVNQINGAPTTVTWTRYAISGSVHNNTVINASGLLTVPNGQNSGSVIGVRATSTFDNTKWAEAVVNVV